MPIPLVLDTDIGSDVDDALALAFAIRHPGIDLRAVTTVSGDTTRRAKIAKKLLKLARRDDIEVAAGERGEQSQPHRSAEGGHEDEMLGADPGDLHLSSRDGVTVLIEECGRGGAQLCVVGMQSNIAAAIDRDPAFAGNVRHMTVMGGVFAPVKFLGTSLPATIDHNLNVDQPASLRALNAGIETRYIGCDVTMSAWLLRPALDKLRKGDALCQELARQIDIWEPPMHEKGRGAIPSDHVALLHDPLAVATIVERRYVTTKQMKVTVAMHDGHVRTFIDPVHGHEAEVVMSVDAERFAQFWLETVLG